jgi:hypothetical protein
MRIDSNNGPEQRTHLNGAFNGDPEKDCSGCQGRGYSYNVFGWTRTCPCKND